MKEEIYKSTTKGKIKFYTFVILLLLFYIVTDSEWFTQLFSVDTSGYSVEQLKTHIAEEGKDAILLSIGAFLIYCCFAYVVFRYGRQVHLSQQYPPPGTNIPFSTKIRRGKKALQQAYAIYAGAALLIIQGVLGIVFSIYMASHTKELLNVI